MAALRATALYYGTVTGTSVVNLYTVPTGKRAIVKAVTVQNQSAGAGTLQLRTSTLATIWRWALQGYGTAGDHASDSFWIVLNAGETLQMQKNFTATLAVIVSGTEHTV